MTDSTDPKGRINTMKQSNGRKEDGDCLNIAKCSPVCESVCEREKKSERPHLLGIWDRAISPSVERERKKERVRGGERV